MKNFMLVTLLLCCGAQVSQAEVLISSTVVLTGSDSAIADWFGSAVATEGDVALVGALLHDPGGAAYLFERNQGGTNAWAQAKKLLPAEVIGNFDRYGRSVAVDGEIAVVSRDYAEVNNVTNAGAVHVFERKAGATGWGEAAKLTASDGTTNDYFGTAVDVSGDVIVVGALGDDDGGNSAGAAYVYERRGIGSSNAWVEIKKLLASDASAVNYFGNAVAVDGDVIVVGAPEKSGGAGLIDAGAVYVFERNSGGENAWGQVAKLTASDAAANRQFGFSVSLDGDVLAVGAPGNSTNLAFNAGYLYTFVRTRGGTNAWQETARLTPSFSAPGQDFARSVSVQGDLVAAGGARSNYVYVFQRDAGGDDAWGEVARLQAPEGLSSIAYFGQSIALRDGALLTGAVNANNTGEAYLIPIVHQEWIRTGSRAQNNRVAGDGFGFAVDVDGAVQIVGAPYRDIDNTNDTGAAYIFERGTSDQVRRLAASAPDEDARFGRAVAVDGDVVVVGAPLTDLTGTREGLAYVFHRDEGGTNNWGQVDVIAPPAQASLDNFGWAVDVSGDTIIASRIGYLASRGAVEFFVRNQGGTGNWGHVKTLRAQDDLADEQFGVSVAIDGDTAIVGASGDSGYQGAAYILQRSSGSVSNWTEVRKLTESAIPTNQLLGWSVDICGDTALVGSYGAMRAFLYERNRGGSNAWGLAAVLIPTSSVALVVVTIDSVKLSGDVAVLGDPFAIVDGTNSAGAAFVYDRNAGGSNHWGQVAVLRNPVRGNNDQFGRGVAADGQTILIGVPNDDPVGITNAGRVQVFSGNLYGAPVIESFANNNNVVTLAFPSQPAWQYDVEGALDLLNGPWIPVPGLLNVPGSTDGTSTLVHTNFFGGSVYRVVREAP